MLDLGSAVRELCPALEDHSPEHTWWFDPSTGEVEFRSYYASDLEENDAEHPAERGFVRVEPISSRKSYADMADFIERLPDPRARNLLERAISGRGAFRRFKDTLLEYPELREAWFRFHDARMERRAIEWLEDEGLITPQVAERAAAARPDPELPAPAGVLDARAVARAVAADLRGLYGDRLKDVILFGSQACGDAGPESDIDLLVVLDEVPSRWQEMDRMSDLLGRHSLANDTVVTEIPVSQAEYQRADTPTLIRARAEGMSVA